jgi:hypothetical protein
MMNFSLNIHRVTDVILGPVKVNANGVGSYGTYATRTIEIKTPEGDFELTLFSEHVGEDHEGELLQVKS